MFQAVFSVGYQFAWVAFLIISFLATDVWAIPQGVKITQIASSTVPGSFKFYSGAGVNESGAVCFRGASSESPTATSSAILVGSGSAPQVVASSTDGSGLFERFLTGVCSINDAGDVAFDACRNCVSPGSIQTGVYKRTVSGILVTIQESGSNDFVKVALPSINNSGAVAFTGALANGINAVFIKDGLQLLRPFDSAGPFFELGGVFMNDSQQLVFAASDDASGQDSIYGPSGSPVIGAFNDFADVSLPVINNNGTIAVMATRSVDGSGGTPESGVFLNGSPFVLSTGNFHSVDISAFQTLSVNDRGDVVFPAFDDSGKSVVYLAVEGGSVPLIEEGEIIPGFSSPVAVVNVAREAINNARQVALVVSLSDGTQSVLRLDPDGIVFPDDQCPLDNFKFSPGVCGCGVSDSDANGDGILNCQVTSYLRQLMIDLQVALRKVKKLPSSAKKAAKQMQAQLKKQVRQTTSTMFALVQSSEAQIQVTNSATAPLVFAKKLRKSAKKALAVNNSKFAANKKSAMKDLKKFLKVLSQN